MVQFLGITVKRLDTCRCWTGTVTTPTKCLWRWEPDRRSNFFVSPPAHLCAVTYITEILLHVMLNNHSAQLSIGRDQLAIMVCWVDAVRLSNFQQFDYTCTSDFRV